MPRIRDLSTFYIRRGDSRPRCPRCERVIEPHGVSCLHCRWDPEDPATHVRSAKGAARVADYDPGGVITAEHDRGMRDD